MTVESIMLLRKRIILHFYPIKKQHIMTRIIVLILMLTGAVHAQSNYEKGMTKAFELWDNQKTDEAANLFQRIAAAETEQWLPDYYVGQLSVLKCWNNWGKQDLTTLKANLDKAQEYVNSIKTKEKGNPYAAYLQAQIYTVWVAYDGMKYGPKYSGQVVTLYNAMLAAQPENPIFILNKAEWDMGGAKFFGTSIAPYCKEIQRAIDLFATFKPETPFHPTYGLERAQEIIKECKA